MTAFEGVTRRLALSAFSRIRGGRLELIEAPSNGLRSGAPSHHHFTFCEPGAELSATVHVRSSRFYRALLGGTVGLGEAYRDGVWDCDDLVALLRIAAR